MDDSESEFGPESERFRNDLVMWSLPLPPFYSFKQDDPVEKKLIRTDGLQEDEVATVFFHPQNDSRDTQKLLLTHIADRLTFTFRQADRRRSLDDKDDDRKQLQPGAKFVFQGQNMGGGKYMYDIRQQIGDHRTPLACFICETKGRHEYKNAIKGALRDLGLTVDNLVSQRFRLPTQPRPHPRKPDGAKP